MNFNINLFIKQFNLFFIKFFLYLIKMKKLYFLTYI